MKILNPLVLRTTFPFRKGTFKNSPFEGEVSEGRWGFGFTLIEILVVVAITALLIVGAGGIMTSSFKAKRGAEVTEMVSIEASKVMEEIKKNILDAEVENINCPSGVGTSISFATKSGGTTTIRCATDLIASISAVGGTYPLLGNGVIAKDCTNFVSCVINSALKVSSIDFAFGLGITGEEYGSQNWSFQTKVSPRR